ncbi:hypothetical protein K2173_028602 [Erythroxylum novogranatense]|uniref:C2 and GRAM domain-containing protein n=1 Tax=Erythroxylum novogranatense TaxID=1862640 RepID=A0AAV8U2J3_9ROSI|nr:hypothetical protein K2173_028602 [Erythroxylum novogranatense]
MRLYVYVLQAKDLPVNDTYVKLKLGKHKSKTKTSKNWNEEFVFKVHDIGDELVVSVYNHEEDAGLFQSSRDLVARVRIPVKLAMQEFNRTLPPTWFSFEQPKTGKFANMDCGKILLTLSLHEKGTDSPTTHFLHGNANVNLEKNGESEGPFTSSRGVYYSKAPSLKIADGKKLMKSITSRLEKVFTKDEEGSRTDESSEVASVSSDFQDCVEERQSACNFEDAIEIMSSRGNEQEMPQNLKGGILIDQLYVTPARQLNKFLFAPGSQFRKDLLELRGSIDLEEEPWNWKSDNMSHLTRTVTYTNAATKLVKAVKVMEEQIYVRVCGQEFAILLSVNTPEVPYGTAFSVQLLYKIIPGPTLSSGEETSHLIISWDINFRQNIMMKGMIEGGARQGLKQSFAQFSNLLTQNFQVVDPVDSSNKDHILATLEAEHQSDWKLAFEYFWNFTVVTTILMVSYVVLHILLCEPGKVQGLEFVGLDLPDSFGQIITCGILFIQLERLYTMVLHFIQARLHKGSDHGIKAKGDGWILTVAVIEGTDLASLGTAVSSDPYVVLTCNGRTRTSSVKLQTSNPQWNDVVEFDAMEEPPSVLTVEVFDFDGPFDRATSLGHAEVNFLKHTSTELADMWVSLEGKLALSSQSKLHLRIFLDNSKGIDTIREYLTKMEKEVGKKLNIRSPHKNATFQKVFGLPSEEFLISDFTCYLKRKMPLQGRLFLSARIVGFYANLFGHKTKFFFLWEDIEDIQELPPSLSSVGSPTLVIVLRKGKGLDARHWARSQDEEGRLRYYFQSFASFVVASRTIMALRRTRTLTPEQKVQIAEEQEQEQDLEGRPIMLEDSDVEDTTMSKIYSVEVPVNIKALMGMFEGGSMERKIMEKSGCLNYTTTAWESVKSDILERHVSYKFNRHVSVFEGEVTCTQQKISIPNDEGWVLNEIMVLNDVPFGDHFHVNFRHQIEKSSLANDACKCDVYAGITWLKSTNFQQRITQNVNDKFTNRFKEIYELAEKEILFSTQQDSSF